MSALPCHSKVVLEASAADALIAVALQEGLLHWDEHHDDGMGRRFSERRFPQWLVEQILEQVVLFEQLHLATRTCSNHISGRLLDEGKVVFVDDYTDTEDVAGSMPLDLMDGLFKAHGVSPSPLEDATIIAEATQAKIGEREWSERYGEDADTVSGLSISILPWILHQVEFRKGPVVEEPRYKELKAIRAGYDRFKPAARAITSYMGAATIAEQRAAHLMSPLYPQISAAPAVLELPSHSDAAFQTILLRVVSSELGWFPQRPTLAQTLEISSAPAAVDLRGKIQEWSSMLLKGEADPVNRVQREIRGASKALKLAKVGSYVSNTITYIGLPILVFSGMAELSALMTAFGAVATVAGTIGQTAFDVTNRRLRWATFGSVRRK